MTSRLSKCAVLVLVLLLIGRPAWAWFADGHKACTRGAVSLLPEEMPAFFRAGVDTIAHTCIDPDWVKHRDAPHAERAEFPNHFIDLELLEGATLPEHRDAFYKWCYEQDLDPQKVGTLPYALREQYAQLKLFFAEHRRWPNNPHIQMKCLVYAGWLAHYTADACQPLHTTIHYNGRANADGSSPKTGFHYQVDALLERMRLTGNEVPNTSPIEPTEDVWQTILAEIARSNALVDKVYEMEQDFPKVPQDDAAWKPTPELMAFGMERLTAASRFTAVLYLTAWEESAEVSIPKWHQRESGGTITVADLSLRVAGELGGASLRKQSGSTVAQAHPLTAQKLEIVQEFWPNSRVHVRRQGYRLADGSLVNHGLYEKWYQNGVKEYEAMYQHDLLVGASRQWHDTGQLWVEEEFVNGVQHGHRYVWDRAGRKRKEEHHWFGKPDGTWHTWDKDGEIKWTNQFDKGDPTPDGDSENPSTTPPAASKRTDDTSNTADD
jgi:hypothetical protein